MFNKKLITLSLVVVLSFTACGKKTETTPQVTPTPTETPVVDEGITEGNEDLENPSEEEFDNSMVASNETLDTIHDKILENFGEDYVATMPFPADAITESFGVESDWYDAAIAEGPMMSTHVDKFLAFHATEGNLENVQNALNAYRNLLFEDTMQYPMNLTKIQGCVVETVGDYVFFVMLGFVDDMAYDDESQIIDAYTELNNSVIDAAKEVIGE